MNSIDKINNLVWADWSFDNFNSNYERITINLSYNTENYYNSDQPINNNCFTKQVTIYCNNFIGFSSIGSWDENIIENINIDSEGDLITSSLQEIERNYGKSECLVLGNRGEKNKKIWYQLNIKLIDGNIIKVACESFEINI